MNPASLGDLLEEAETATTRLIIARPSLTLLAASWSDYTASAERLLRACVGVRESNNPVDAALSRTADEAKAARRGAARTCGLGESDLARIADLLSAAADLLDTHPSLDPPAAQLAGLRVAAIVAASSHTVVVAERTRRHEGTALRALHLEQVASRALAQRAWPARLDEPRAAPVPDPTHDGSVAEIYQSSALAWRRIAAQDVNPSDHVLRTGALSIAHITTDLRFILAANGVKGGLDEDLRRSQERWDIVAQAWSGITTATPLTLDARAAAVHLRSTSDALRAEARTAATLSDHATLEALLTAVVRGHRDMAALGNEQLSITHRLGRAGRLYISARDLPRNEERVEAILRGRFVPAPSDRLAPLVGPTGAAVAATSHAAVTVDRTLATRDVRGRPPHLDALTNLAVRSQHLARGR